MKALHVGLILISMMLLSSCTPTGLASPGPSGADAWANNENATRAEIKQELIKCGDGDISSKVKLGESVDNARARAEECMFAKGFYIKSGNGGYCSDYEYRMTLPICKNAPIRPNSRYYGQTITPEEEIRYRKEMESVVKEFFLAGHARLGPNSLLEMYYNPNKVPIKKIYEDIQYCGYDPNSVEKKGIDKEEISKHINRIECMLNKGYTLSSNRRAKYCKIKDYQDQLSVCQNPSPEKK